MGRVERSRRSAAGVEEERGVLRELVEDPPEVPVGKVDPPREEGRELPARERMQASEELVRELLGPEHRTEAVVVDAPLDLVGRDHELVGGHGAVVTLRGT